MDNFVLWVMSDFQEVRARRIVLNSQIKACAAKKKLAARTLQAYTKRAKALWAVPPGIMMDALRLYAACEWNLLPAVTFLRRVGGQRHWPSLGNRDIENLPKRKKYIFPPMFLLLHLA